MNFHDIIWFDRLPSTNGWLKEQLALDPPPPAGTVVAAREQTAGRGRKGRHWHCGPDDLAFSFLLAPTVAPHELPTLPMVVALAVHDVLAEYGIHAMVKWPNDVVVEGRKICGILSECFPHNDGTPRVVVGVGLNVGMDAAACGLIPKPASSLPMETGQRPPPDVVLAGLLERVEHWLAIWEQEGFAGIRGHWRAHAHKLGETIGVDIEGCIVDGIFEDVGPHGELRLRTAAGMRSILLGEIT
jgi:BirA family transcriptional regulator, biotin operon repressor / biotin---[acetyl-CoA-carboxylase] ligase